VTTGGRSPDELADTAYEAIRALNHATSPAQCELDSHESLYCVVGNLAALLHITPQALGQCADWIARAQRADRVDVDAACPSNSATTVAAIVTALEAAANAVAEAARRAERAHQAAAHLITKPDSPPGPVTTDDCDRTPGSHPCQDAVAMRGTPR
jgi:hypothetical protein